MANFTGGDIIEAVCSHPTLGTFRFQAKANEAFTLNRGGLRNNDDANSITGAGQAIWQMNRTRWSLSGPVAVDFGSDYEMAALDALAESPVEGVWTLTHVSAAVYRGTGKPVADIEPDTNQATVTLKIAGSGKLVKLP